MLFFFFFWVFLRLISCIKTSVLRTSQPTPCPRATSQALDVLPLNEPATGFWELPNKFPWVRWAPSTYGHKAGECWQHSGLYLQQSEMHPGGDLGWKVRICRVCSHAQKRSPLSDQNVGLSSQLSAKWGLTTLLLLLRLEATQTASESYQKSTGAVQC